jgi:hypothetical protein
MLSYVGFTGPLRAFRTLSTFVCVLFRFQLAPNERSALQKYLDRTFEAGCDALIEAHAALIVLDQENARTLSTRLVLPEGASEQYEQQRKAYEGLHR